MPPRKSGRRKHSVSGQLDQEVNPVEYYFAPNTHTYRWIRKIREDFLSGRLANIDPDLIKIVQREVSSARKKIDASTYQAGQDLGHEFLGKDTRVLMLVEGTFGGKESIKSIIPVDLGMNPHRLFEDYTSRGTTIDDTVTNWGTDKYLTEHKGDILSAGHTYFVIEKSFFYYVQQGDLVEGDFLEPNGKANMEKLAPYLKPTRHVGIAPVELPSESDYRDNAPLCFSYRLKQTVLRKLIRNLFSTSPERLKDWRAYRRVVEKKSDVDSAEAEISRAANIGTSKISYDYTDDFYAEPKDTGWKAKNVVLWVRPKGHGSHVSPLQIMDRRQNWRNEFDSNSPTFHGVHDQQQEHGSRKREKYIDHYLPVLESIFVRDPMMLYLV